jgi:hypothetical protein
MKGGEKMITDEKKEWLEQIYIGFTKALFAMGEVPFMYMIVVDDKAEVIPPAPDSIDIDVLPAIVASYANARSAELILHISEGWAVEAKDGIVPNTRPSQHPNRIETLTLLIGEPSGTLHGILGRIKRTNDGTPYVQEWEWLPETLESPSGLIQSFDD